MQLSIIIPSLNSVDLLNTIASIRATAGSSPEVIVVDDGSKIPVQIPSNLNVRLFRNQQRIGVAQSRHFGAERARGDFLLFLDDHMICEPGWFEKVVPILEGHPRTLFNGCVPGLSEKNMDITRFAGKPAPGPGFYTGATLCIYNPNDPSVGHQILEGKWKNHQNMEEVACMMGAQYYVPRDVFFNIGGLKALERWGTDEPLISLKAWLAGYEIRQLNEVRIGHKFRAVPDAPYTTEVFWLTYNKMRVIMTVFPQDVAEFLFSKFPQNRATTLALNAITKRKSEIEAEYQFHQSIFTRDLDWYCNRFPDVKHPLRP